MKTSKMKIILASLFLLLTFHVNAQDKSTKKAMREEIKTYTVQHVIPVIKEQRLKLDQELSSTEKRKLENVRQELKSQKKANSSFHKEIKELKKSGKELNEAQKEQLQKMREEKKLLLDEVRVIAKKHEGTIKTLHEDIKDDKEQWKQDMKTIRSKYISDEEMKEMRNQRIDKMIDRLEKMKNTELGDEEMKKMKRQMGKGMKGKGNSIKKWLAPIGFLLMDPNQEFEFPEKKKNKIDADVYPNPANYKNQIDFDLSKNGHVKIEMLDRQGNIIKTILDEDLKKGKHMIPVDVSTLPSNIYYYKITTKSGAETKKFLKD